MKRSRFSEEQIIGILKEHLVDRRFSDLLGQESWMKLTVAIPRVAWGDQIS